MALTVRPITADEVLAFRSLIYSVFGGDVEPDERGSERFVAVLPVERTCAAFDGDAMVSTSGTFELSMGIPGGTLPVAGLTVVTVQPTHTRRGLLTRMMDRHVADAADRGDAVSALWASEASIYGRFGFGIASYGDEVSFDGSGVTIDDRLGVDRVVPIARDQIVDQVADLYARCAAERPGSIARSDTWWEHRHVHDPLHRRDGASKRRYVVALRGGDPVGYLCYRQRGKWEDGLARGQMVVVELLAADPRAEASLWRFAATVDLFPRVTYWNAPVDSVLPWVASDFRRIARTRRDALWIRVLDVPAALSARSYAVDGELCLRIGDDAYVLSVAGGRGACEPADREPDLVVDCDALGSIYLGGIAPSTLARAGRIRGATAAIELADRVFAWPTPPWCCEVF